MNRIIRVLVLLGFVFLAPAALATEEHGSESPQPSPAAPAADAAHGKELFTAMGCAACHGASAGGTAIGPAIAGHTPDQVRKQVRSPVGNMPAFSKGRLSDGDLDKIVAFIASLKPAEAPHGHAFELTVPVHHHLLLALNSLKAEDEKDALHHTGHALLAAKGEEREAVEKIEANVRAGKHHDAEHDMESLASNAPGAALSFVQLHADLAHSALDRKNTTDAEHHVAHALEKASASEKATLEDILDHLKKVETDEAKKKLESLSLAGVGSPGTHIQPETSTPAPGTPPAPAAGGHSPEPRRVVPTPKQPGLEAGAAMAALLLAGVVLLWRKR